MRVTLTTIVLATSLATAPLALAQNAASGSGTPAGQSAAGGTDNQAVATTNANAAQPAHGANSFSKKEAHHRMEVEGFHQVSDLHKDQHGVWVGTAMKNGQQTSVWLDFKGNVGAGTY